MSDRTKRSALVTAAIIAADKGWSRDPFAVPGAVANWGHNFPNTPIVSDGETDRGRGSTAFDLVRSVDIGSIRRFDWLSIKTAAVEGLNKVPSQFKLSTGNPETVASLIDAVKNGASYATLFFASKGNSEKGYALCADLAPYIRQFGVAPIEDYPIGGYGRGKAPPFYVKWSRPRPSGVKRLQRARNAGIPVDETIIENDGVRYGPGWIQYSEFTMSLAALGVRRSTWNAGVNVNSLPLFLDRSEGFGGTSEVRWDNM
jgi:hypothetical protein